MQLYSLSEKIMRLGFICAIIVFVSHLFGFNQDPSIKYLEPVTQEIPIDYRQEMMEFIQVHEGGISNHSKDPGGWTNKGITFSTFKLLSKQCNYVPSKKNFVAMPDSIWDRVFDLHWNMFAEVKDPRVRAFCTDYVWGSGTTGIHRIQAVVKIHQPSQKIDNRIGKKTIDNINSISSKVLLNTLYQDRKYFLTHLHNSKYFATGWIKRVDALMVKFEAWERPVKMINHTMTYSNIKS